MTKSEIRHKVWQTLEREGVARFPGATGRTFSTPELNATSAYWVRVSNACGTVDSNTATVTVHY